jgi:exopolyphosphatase/guanosine-5'-triphosphate,3'-diphosphate pyrophosphatase
MVKKAAIDIGTNSTRLLIAEINGNIKRIQKLMTITRLGKGVDRYKRLSPESIEKNISTLLKYKRIADDYGIDDIAAIATSAVRDASNRDEFVRTVKEKTGIDVEIISGEEEARLGFIGAISSSPGPSVVVDIGGGSTEFVAGRNGDIKISRSLDIGAVRITERFLYSEDMDGSSLIRAYEYIKSVARPTVDDIRALGDFRLIGVGGTITTLAAVDLGLVTYDSDKVHGYRLKKESVCSAFKKFLSVNLNDRKRIAGLQPERADIIIAGTLILKIIMEEMDAGSIIVSEQDNLEGLLLKRFGC